MAHTFQNYASLCLWWYINTIILRNLFTDVKRVFEYFFFDFSIFCYRDLYQVLIFPDRIEGFCLGTGCVFLLSCASMKFFDNIRNDITIGENDFNVIFFRFSKDIVFLNQRIHLLKILVRLKKYFCQKSYKI